MYMLFHFNKFAKSYGSIVKNKLWKQEQEEKKMMKDCDNGDDLMKMLHHEQVELPRPERLCDKKLPMSRNLIEATRLSSACLLAAVRQNLPLSAEPYASASLKKKLN